MKTISVIYITAIQEKYDSQIHNCVFFTLVKTIGIVHIIAVNDGGKHQDITKIQTDKACTVRTTTSAFWLISITVVVKIHLAIIVMIH